MKKKVLFLIESLAGGGAEKVLSVIMRYYDHEKYEVTVCPIVDEGIYADQVRQEATKYTPIISYSGNSVSRLWNRMKYKFIYSILPLEWVYRWFVPHYCNVEIAFCEGYATKLIAHSSAKTKKIAWVHTDLVNNPWPLEIGIYKDVEEERKAYACFDKIVCVSKSAEKSFVQKYGLKGKTCTLYNPIDIAFIRKKAGEKRMKKDDLYTIISVGRLVPQKGYDSLLAVIKRLHDEHDIIRLLILGEGEERSKLEQYIHSHHMESYVSLPGFDANPYEKMINADLFVCSSHVEGFSLVIAEAMALGIPVVSTYCAGPNELLEEGKCGLIVKDTEENLYKGLVFAMGEEMQENGFVQRATQRISLLDVSYFKEEIERILN